MPNPDLCAGCGKQLTAEEIEAYGDYCEKCHKEYLEATRSKNPDDPA